MWMVHLDIECFQVGHDTKAYICMCECLCVYRSSVWVCVCVGGGGGVRSKGGN